MDEAITRAPCWICGSAHEDDETYDHGFSQAFREVRREGTYWRWSKGMLKTR